jgi:hypothetical protein
MTPAAAKDSAKQALGSRAATRRRHDPPVATPTGLARQRSTNLKVLEIMSAEDRPLTLKQIASLTRLPASEVAAVLEALCEIRLVRRLNTVIECYTAHFR